MFLPFTMPEYLQDSEFYYKIDEDGLVYMVGKAGDFFWKVPTGTEFFYRFKQYKRKTCTSAPASEVERLLQPFKA